MSKAQRNVNKQPEMEAPKKTKAAKAAKATKEPKAKTKKASPEVAQTEGIPEGLLATPLRQEEVTPPDLDAPMNPESESCLKFCSVCDNYLYMQMDGESQELRRICRKCGFKEDSKGGLVMEMMIQQRSSEGYKVLLNEFTRKDPRLPHIRKNIACPNVACESNHGKDPDVIYIKYDLVNLMYLYICDICGDQWHSRSRL
jgi:DNA-directed RNA polymerase subunit M/transcription elongation factor TFIIS